MDVTRILRQLVAALGVVAVLVGVLVAWDTWDYRRAQHHWAAERAAVERYYSTAGCDAACVAPILRDWQDDHPAPGWLLR